MKKILNFLSVVIVLNLALAVTANAQDEQPIKHKNPSWLPEEGYWVVTSNKERPRSNEVNFYTSNNQLIYTEKIEGVKLNIQKTKVKKQLKKAFDQAYKMWAANLKMNDQRLIATLVQ